MFAFREKENGHLLHLGLVLCGGYCTCGLIEMGSDQNANPLCKDTYSKHTFVGVMDNWDTGKYSYPAILECTMTRTSAQ